MKRQISFYSENILDLYLMNTDQFLFKKNLDLYLMKIQISFYSKKIPNLFLGFRSSRFSKVLYQ